MPNRLYSDGFGDCGVQTRLKLRRDCKWEKPQISSQMQSLQGVQIFDDPQNTTPVEGQWDGLREMLSHLEADYGNLIISTVLENKYSLKCILYFFLKSIPLGQQGSHCDDLGKHRTVGEVCLGQSPSLPSFEQVARILIRSHRHCEGQFLHLFPTVCFIGNASSSSLHVLHHQTHLKFKYPHVYLGQESSHSQSKLISE